VSSLAEQFRQFAEDDCVSGPNGYVLALEAVLNKCAELRARRFPQYGDEVAEEIESIFTQMFGVGR
jgi:hypothetical protein